MNDNNLKDNNNQNNLITYIIIGLAVIIVCLIIVFCIEKVTSFKDSDSVDIQMNVGDNLNVFEKINDPTIDISSAILDMNNEGIININSETGNIEAIGNGQVTITIKSKNNNAYEKKLTIEVKNGEPWVKFDSANYSCEAGEVIDTKITAGGTEVPTRVSSYESSDSSIATIESGFSDGSVTNCLNCIAVHITCKKKGTVSLNATSEAGAKTTSTLTVNAKTTSESGWVKFDSANYSCEVGEVIDTKITAGGTEVPTRVSSYESSDSSIATIESGFSDGSVTNCLNCTAVHITCKKKGTVSLNATSEAGAKTTSTLTVNEKTTSESGWVKFDSANYSCKVGEIIDTKITAGGTEVPTRVSSYESSDSSIATIESGFSDGSVTNCLNCTAVHITCKKKGETILTATSQAKAKVNVKITVE